MSEFMLETPFKSWSDRIKDERILRLDEALDILPFGVPYLDRSLGGISRHDLILLGGLTGGGKSELVNIIAENTVREGKRVHVMALEAEPLEFERRLKFRMLASKFFEDPYRAKSDAKINYMDWRLCRLEAELGPYDDAVNDEMDRIYRPGFSCYRIRNFGLPEVEKAILSIQTTTDLIILDHLHYIDLDDENENRGMKALVKHLRDIALEIGKPVILVAHIRKMDRRIKSLMPGLEDFHGSSDIVKVCTKAIMIAPATDIVSANGQWGTYMRAAKNRMDGSRTRFMGLCWFDPRKAAYERQFRLGRYYDGIAEFDEIANAKDFPHWAR